MLIPSAFVGSALRTAETASVASLSGASVLSSATAVSSSSLQMALDSPVAKVATNLVIPVAISVARGGGIPLWDQLPPDYVTHFCTTKGVFDVGRAKMRLEGLQAYGTICALLMNATLRLFSSVSEPKSDDDSLEGKWNNRAFNAFLVTVIVSVLFGSYTTIVFSMIALYSKQALGRGMDSNFMDFYVHTHGLRESGFRAFLYSLASFQGAFILSLFLKYRGDRRKWFVFLAVVISLLSARRWSYVITLASKLIFAAPSP